MGGARTTAVRAPALPGDDVDPDATLSPRQRQVLAGLACGLSQQEIAVKLGMSAWTVGNYVESARAVLGARTTVHAVALAIRHGLIRMEGEE